MSIDGSARRYAKGETKRLEILAAALELVATGGYRNSTLQDIADAVHLTKAGVLHYFESRDDLMAQVLAQRDAAWEAQSGDSGDMLHVLGQAIVHNASVPGLVQLYSRVVVEAENPAHVAHQAMLERYARLAERLAASVRERQIAGTAHPDLDPAQVARLAIALSDGLQLQWLYHPAGPDMAHDFDAALTLILGAARIRS